MKDSPEPRKSLFRKIQERAAASRFLTVSLLIHLGIIIVAGGVVLVTQPTPPEHETFVTSNLPSPKDEAAPPPTDSVALPELQKSPLPPTDARPPFPTPPTTTNPPPSGGVPIIPIVTKVGRAPAPTGPVGIPGPGIGNLDGRTDAASRARQIAKLAGPRMDPKKNEKAVTDGLRWLVNTQKTDGSWAAQHQAAMTGFALLAFLGHGELPASPEFGKTVGAGLDWVLVNGEKHNGRLSMESTITQQGAYAHAIVTYALGEYCTLTDGRDERAASLFRQAIKYIVDGQGPDGGWMYRYDKTQSDTSVTGWQLQALKVAHLSGLKIEGVDEAIAKAMQNLRRVQGSGGGFGYRRPEDKYSLTGVGVLCSTFAPQPKDMEKPIENGIKFMMAQLAANPVEYQHPKADLYAWYYNTQACMTVGAESRDATLHKAWTDWNAAFAQELIRSQAPDGSWPPMAVASHGNLQKDEVGAGPYYRTCLSVLMLEVYYRYKPTALR